MKQKYYYKIDCNGPIRSFKNHADFWNCRIYIRLLENHETFSFVGSFQSASPIHFEPHRGVDKLIEKIDKESQNNPGAISCIEWLKKNRRDVDIDMALIHIELVQRQFSNVADRLIDALDNLESIVNQNSGE